MVLTALIQIASLFLTSGTAPARLDPPITAPASGHRVSRALVHQEGTLHFAGLVMFTTHANRDHISLRSVQTAARESVIAILPRVASLPHKHASPSAYTATPAAAPGSNFTGVEPHIAVMAFQPGAFVGTPQNWTVVTPLPVAGVPLLQYIVLNGEHLHVVSTDTNPADITKLKMALPKTPVGSGLQPPFQFPYSGAAAVFEIPSGTLIPCFGEAATGRYDTNLTVQNNGTFTIESDDMVPSARKSITFHGNAKVEVANVPELWFQSRTAMNDEAHYTVYCAMTGATQCQLTFPAYSVAQTIHGCSDNNMLMIPKELATETPAENARVKSSDKGQASDIFCSNTTWP